MELINAHWNFNIVKNVTGIKDYAISCITSLAFKAAQELECGFIVKMKWKYMASIATYGSSIFHHSIMELPS